MKNFSTISLLFVITLLINYSTGYSQDENQDDSQFELSYDVQLNYPALSISKDSFQKTETLEDLNRSFDSKWINTYYSGNITTIRKGAAHSRALESIVLSKEDKAYILAADLGKPIEIKINYLPENNLRNNEPKDFGFSFSLDPVQNAFFPGGDQDLKKYIKEHTVERIDAEVFSKYKMAVANFTVNEKGQVTQPKISWSTDDPAVDAVLLEAICNMPAWKPAALADGTKVSQDYVLTIGDKESCVTNTLNTDRDRFKKEEDSDIR